MPDDEPGSDAAPTSPCESPSDAGGAEGSACANEQNRFWEFHDIAFETKGKISQAVLMDIASTIDLDLKAFKSCLDSDRGLRVVQEDINAAIHAGFHK